MKKFFVSKSDSNKVKFLQNAISEIKPDVVYILCEDGRANIFDSIDAVILPLKELNKNKNWITFVNTFTNKSLIVVDNILKFIHFGDGKKKYLKDISQSINNIIVMDVVPFYTEPYEIFYPFWFLGKEILGYNSYNTFKANHLEEGADGCVDVAHSFFILKDKIKDYYIQDYDCFFKPRRIINWEMSYENKELYLSNKSNALEKYNNPIKMKTAFADYVNLLKEKADVVKSLINGRTCFVINYLPYAKKIKSFFYFQQFDILSYHEKDLSKFKNYDTVIFYDNIIVKPHTLFYLESNIDGDIINLIETSTGIDVNLFNSIYNIELRTDFDNYFGSHENL
jgi:hypothetical protein